MKRTSWLIAPALGVVSLAVAVVIVARSQPEHPVTPPLRQPPTKPTAGAIAGVGLVEPSSEQIGIGTHVSGVVREVLVSAGSHVSAGEPLFRIDDRDARADVNAKRAALEVAHVNRAEAETDLRDKKTQLGFYDRVTDRRAISEEELTRRRFAVEHAEARLRLQIAREREAAMVLEAERTTLDRHTVASPITGEVLQVRVRVGEYAQTGVLTTPLMVVGVTDPLHVRVDFDEYEVGKLRVGAPASLSPRGQADLRMDATFVRVEPLVIPKKALTGASDERVDTRVLQVIYAIEPGEKRLFVGQQVDVFVARDEASRAGL